jgi:6-phosphogluconate dehydratase
VDKVRALDVNAPNLGIVSAYNDMLSAHQPLEEYPALIKDAAREVGATAQFAGGVPAMCDGVTQGRPGMELSLFSRDVIAMATGIALTHDAFDGALYLGVCDKIVPGLLIGALTFSHLPAMFVPAGPMTSGLPNSEKARIRALYAEGKVGREELLAAESASYHGPGTCTFYGTANTNQMLMELMGLHLPGSAFVHPQHAAAHGPGEGSRQARGRHHPQGQRLDPGRPDDRREGRGQRRGRPDGHRRLDQPGPAPGGHGPCGRHHPDPGRPGRHLQGHAAAGQGLSERLGRREPVPRRRRHPLRGQASC